ncbi:MAG TPA: hypothetical protein VN112_09630 [Ensifer sp.]|nr:hypothetical protein [Ensifer sp.]
MPEIMRPMPLEPFTPSDEAIAYQLRYRWFYHQAATALRCFIWCPQHACRRMHACLSYEPDADFRLEPMKLYPACIRNYDAARLLQSALEDIIRRAEAIRPGNALDPAHAPVFVKAAREFGRARIEAAKAEKAAAEKAAADAERRRLLREKRK